MEGEWKLVRLGDHVDSCLGKMLDKNKNRGTLHPYLGNKNVRWGRFELQNLSQMKFQEDEHDRYGLLSGDLTVCEGGEPGRCAIWKNEVSGMKIQKALHRIRPLDGLNNIYLYYWFVFSANNGLLDPFFTGTTIKHLTGKSLADLQLPLPPLSEQKRIAYILGSLDDKIELNRQMNATLEGMAQALFKSWFVDFDPVIDNALAAGNPIPEAFSARAETRRKALAHGTANRDVAKQFPAAFQITEEMGWVPEGWEIGKINQLAMLNPESWNNKNHPQNIKYVDLANTKNGRINEIFPYVFPDAPSRARRVLREDDTIIGTVRPGNRSFAYIHEDGLTGSTGFAVLRPKKINSRSFIYLCLTQDEVIERFAHLADGAAYPAIRSEVVGSQETIIFKADLMTFFDQQCYPLFLKIGQHQQEVLTLTKLRDTLLPKLISGEIRIPEAEKLTEEALA